MNLNFLHIQILNSSNGMNNLMIKFIVLIVSKNQNEEEKNKCRILNINDCDIMNYLNFSNALYTVFFKFIFQIIIIIKLIIYII